MSFSAHITANSLEPGLAQAVKVAEHPRPILEAMGLALVSIAKRSFTDASLRPAAWPPKRDGSTATLRKTGALWQSIHIDTLTDTEVSVGSDRKYAAIHQFGGEIHAKGGGQLRFAIGNRIVFAKKVRIPARPFIPVLNGALTPRAYETLDKVAEAKLRSMLPGVS